LYKAVIFDLDGTLLNTIDDLSAAGNYTLRQLGLPEHTVADFTGYVGNGIPKLISRMLPADRQQLRDQALEIFSDYYALHKADRTAPYPGIPQLLAALSAAGVRLAVLSNKAHDMTLPIVRQYFGDRFFAVQGLAPGMAAKPDPAGAIALVQGLGFDQKDILYVGDSDTDMRTAHNAGLVACGVLWGFRSEKVLLAAGAEYTVLSAEQLRQLILGETGG